jgi:hypothetical protein
MITAQHQLLLAETLKSMTPIELTSLLEDIADHFKREKLVPIIKKAFDFDEYESDVLDLEEQLDEAKDALSDISRLCLSVTDKDDVGVLKSLIEEVRYKADI